MCHEPVAWEKRKRKREGGRARTGIRRSGHGASIFREEHLGWMNLFSHVSCPFVRGVSIAVSGFRVAVDSKNFLEIRTCASMGIVLCWVRRFQGRGLCPEPASPEAGAWRSLRPGGRNHMVASGSGLELGLLMR